MFKYFILFLVVGCSSSSSSEQSYFSSSSPWNSEIVDPKIDVHSDLIIFNLASTLKNSPSSVEALNSPWDGTAIGHSDFGLRTLDLEVSTVHVNSSHWSSPVYRADDGIPFRAIQSSDPYKLFYHSIDPNNEGVAYVPMLESYSPDPETDAHMVVIKGDKSYELGGFDKEGMSAISADVWDLNGTGVREPFIKNWWKSGVRGAGTPFIAGLILEKELLEKLIPHALAVSTPINRIALTGSGGWGLWELCADVASNTDATHVGPEYVAQGTRLQLNPDWDSSGLGDYERAIVEAMRTYGLIVVDNAPDFSIYVENTGTFWDLNLAIPITEFRVLECTNYVQLKLQ